MTIQRITLCPDTGRFLRQQLNEQSGRWSTIQIFHDEQEGYLAAQVHKLDQKIWVY